MRTRCTRATPGRRRAELDGVGGPWLPVGLLGVATAVVLFSVPAAADDVAINEFMAANATTLTNAEGETADWIELHNPTSTNIDLGGWHLTDRRDNLAKWTFPSTNIAPNGYLLIFASGRSTPTIGTERHANFKLDDQGEYLALVKPDGVTVASEYAPEYPAQMADVSFGLRPDTETTLLLASNAIGRFKVPADASDGTNWTALGFDDAGWGQGRLGIGYESAPGDFAGLIQTPVPDLTQGVYVRCRFEVANPALLDSLLLRVKYDDGFVAYVNDVRAAAANDPAGLRWDSAATAEQTNSEAVVFADFDLSAYRSALAAGTNILAIHLLNRPVSPRVPSDLLLIAELSAETAKSGAIDEWRYFRQPTPGARNLLGTLDCVRPVEFSETRGFRDAPFDLALTTPTPGAEVYYSTDSSVPTSSNGSRYAGPFPITRTTVVRARAFKRNEEPSVVETHTYLFPADIIASPSMRTSITRHPVYGPQMTNALRALPTVCLATTSTTIDYSPELPTSLELIWPDGRAGVQVNAGVARFGNYWIRGGNYEKRMFRLYFREKYGAGKWRYPLFAGFERGVEPVDEFDQLDLRSGSQDMADRGFYMSESFCDDAMLEMGHLNPHGRFVHVYLNGQYWGVYYLHERWKANTLAAYLGGEPEDYQADDSEGTMNNWADEPVHPVDGDGSAWTRLIGLRTDYQALRAYLDVPQFLDFMLFWFMGSGESEFRGAGPIAANAGGYKLWLKDPDGWLRGLYHPLSDAGPGGLLGGLRQEQHPDYVVLERDRIYRLFFANGPLTAARNQARLTRRCDEMEPAFPAEAARWGYRTPASWATEKAAALARFVTQTDQMIANLRAAGWYPLDAPEFNPTGVVFNGAVDVAMSASNGASILFSVDGEDPRESGTGAEGGYLYRAPLHISRATLLKARAKLGNTWSALHEALYVPAEPNPLRVTELMYHPRKPDAVQSNWTERDFQFIELRNTGQAALGLAGVRFTDGIEFDFTTNAVQTLAPGEYVLVVKNRAAFAARYPEVPARLIAGEFAAVANWPVKTFSDGGERVRLVDGLGSNIVSFTYGNGRSWPTAADGAGHSLVPLALDDQSDLLECGGNWRASAFIDGSPGAADPEPIRDLVVNEIVAHTDYSNAAMPEYDSNDWLELLNNSAAAIGLGAWHLSDRADNLRLWPIPATHVIAAGGLIVFDEIHDFHSPITNGFGLNKAGDQVFLSFLPGDGRDRVADAVRFDGQENGLSLGRYPDGAAAWYAMSPSAAATNREPIPAVVISEIMFHPPGTNGADNTTAEFIELYSPLGATASLWDADGPWRIDGDVSWAFPGETSLAPGERLVLVSFDPASNTAARAGFLAAYGLTNGQVRLLGPFAGTLSNRGGRLALEKPLPPDLPGDPMAWVVVDEVSYFDRAPWPIGADGTGRSLARTDARLCGRDPRNWYVAQVPTPGLPADRVALTAPADEGVVFAPGPQTLQAAVDSGPMDAPAGTVLFREGIRELGSQTTAPYVLDWSIAGPGRYELSVEFTEASRTWTSRTVRVTALAVSNILVEAATDEQADFRGRLAGEIAAEVRVYWGQTDGGTQSTVWESSALVGAVSNAGFAIRVGNLQRNRRYYVRASARVGSQQGWSPQSVAFITPGYGQRPYTARIRFSGYAENEPLSGFPALVLFGPHLAGFSYAQCGADWSSLRFTDDAGGERLPYEMDTWDTNGISAVWVRVPALTNGAAIRAYWGAIGTTNPPPETQDGSVWRDSYEAVWHLGASLDNAAAPGTPLRNGGSTPAAGVVGDGRNFDGLDDSIEPATAPAWYNRHLTAQTWSLWVRPSSESSSAATVFGAGGTTNRLYVTLNTAPRLQKWMYGVGASELPAAPYDLGAWQMLVMVLSNGTVYAQLNDGAMTACGTYGAFALTNRAMLGQRGGAGFPFAGLIDEVRLAPVARSAAWLRAEYRTAASPFSFADYEPVRHTVIDDEDGDGLSDAWECLYFGNTSGDGRCDADGDGMSDADEYIAGSDPTDAASVLRLTIALGADEPKVLVPTLSVRGFGYERLSRHYVLEAAPDLAARQWDSVLDWTNLPGADLLLVYTNASAFPGSRFFRARVRLGSMAP